MPSLLGPAEIRALAADLDVTPSKKRGQNFVHDAAAIRKIVRLAAVDGERVLEIGPGLGSLTLGLLEQAQSVVAVEIDARLAAQLPLTVAAHGAADRLTVVHNDALAVTALPGPPATALVANLPYNLAVPLLLTVLERFDTITHGLVMVQAEVAERLVAPPGSKIYGSPSAKLAWYAAARRAGTIARTVFWPAPNVDSALVAFDRTPPPGPADRGCVFAVVDAAFATRRKTLRSCLAGLAGSADAAARAVEAAGLDPGARGEQLGIAEFARIAEQLPCP